MSFWVLSVCVTSPFRFLHLTNGDISFLFADFSDSGFDINKNT